MYPGLFKLKSSFSLYSFDLKKNKTVKKGITKNESFYVQQESYRSAQYFSL